MEDIVNSVVDMVFGKIGSMFVDFIKDIFSSLLDVSYAIALLGAGLAILFGLIGFEKYYKVAGGFFLFYVLINYLVG